jgi:hypothetical protein
VIENATDFAIEDANDLRSAWDLEPQEPFDRQDEGVLLVNRRDVVETVEVTDILGVWPCLDQLLGAAVQKADMRIDAFDEFTVQFQNQAQNAMRRRVLRAEIQVEFTAVVI